jgi:hypothetical protein
MFLFIRDSYHAMVLALVVWTITLGPASLYVYRPDLFSTTSRMLVFPANLIWYQSPIQTYGPIVLAGLAVGSAGLTWLASIKIGRAPLN